MRNYVILSEAHVFGEELPVLPEKYLRKKRAVKNPVLRSFGRPAAASG